MKRLVVLENVWMVVNIYLEWMVLTTISYIVLAYILGNNIVTIGGVSPYHCVFSFLLGFTLSDIVTSLFDKDFYALKRGVIHMIPLFALKPTLVYLFNFEVSAVMNVSVMLCLILTVSVFCERLFIERLVADHFNYFIKIRTFSKKDDILKTEYVLMHTIRSIVLI